MSGRRGGREGGGGGRKGGDSGEGGGGGDRGGGGGDGGGGEGGGREGGDGGERGGGGDGGRVGGSAHASGSSATRSSHAPRHDPARHLTRRPELLLPTEAAPKRGGHIPKSTAMSANVR